MKIYTQADLAKMFKCSGSYIAYLKKLKVIKPLIAAKKRGLKNIYDENTVLAIEKHFAEKAQNKGFKGGFYKESKCWSCLKSYNGCIWSREFKPVPGWKATKMDISLTKNVTAYVVKDCPEYEKEEWIKTRDGRLIRKNPVPEAWKETTVRYRDLKDAMERKPFK